MMVPSAIILSNFKDEHAFLVQAEAKALGFSIDIVDTSSTSLVLTTSYDGTSFRTLMNGEIQYDLSSLLGLWWRRPAKPRPNAHGMHPSVANFVSRELEQSVFGALLSAGVRMINPFDASALARFKIFQHKKATEAGFKIPRTIISSSQSDIQRHSEDWKSDLIFKPFSGIEFGAYETRMLQPGEVSNPVPGRHCSPTFQAP